MSKISKYQLKAFIGLYIFCILSGILFCRYINEHFFKFNWLVSGLIVANVFFLLLVNDAYTSNKQSIWNFKHNT